MEDEKGRRVGFCGHAKDTDAFLHKLARSCRRLNLDRQSIQAKSLTVEALQNVLQTLQRYIEANYGRSNNNLQQRSAFTKLPIEMFMDYSDDGPTFCLLREVFVILDKKQLQSSDVTANNESLLEEILQSLEKALLNASFLKRPVIYFEKLSDSTVRELSEIVLSHGGEVCQSEEAATHVVSWNEEVDSYPQDLVDNFIRILRIESDEAGHDPTSEVSAALVHWWYFPDSYDEWIAGSEVDSSEPPDIACQLSSKRPWRVCCRFVRDCALFNEWGRETDYEQGSSGDNNPMNDTDVGNAEKKSKSRRKQTNFPTKLTQTRGAPVVEAIGGTEKLWSDLFPPSLEVRLGGENVRAVLMQPNSSDMCILVNERRRPDSSIAGKVHGRKRKADEAVCIRPHEGITLQLLTGDRDEPSSEELQLAAVYLRVSDSGTATESGSGAVTIAEYRSLRRAIIGICSLNPSQYTCATECRRSIAGDASLIVALHSFLSALSIINMGCRLESKQPSVRWSRRICVPSTIVECESRGTDCDSSLAARALLLDTLSMSERDASSIAMKRRHIEESTKRLRLLTGHYLAARMAALHSQLTPLSIVGNLTEIDREQADVENRCAQLRRAQFAATRDAMSSSISNGP